MANPFWGQWGFAHTYALAGRRDEARKIVTELEVEEPTPWSAFSLAVVYTALGEKDEAFRWLEAAYKSRHSYIPWAGWNPSYESLRDDPRFQDLLQRLNLPE